LLLAATFLLAGPGGAGAAAWGSIRGTNRSAEQELRTTQPAPARQAPARRGENAGHGVLGRREERRGERAPERGFEARPVERFGGERAEQFRRGEEWREHRDLGIDGDLRHSYPWFGFSPGVAIQTLPPDYFQFDLGGNPYYYGQGLYYQPGPSGYVVVTPPIGALVPQLPPVAEAISVGQVLYYYAAGAFYVQEPRGFRVVTPPLGITVTELPPGAVPVTLHGLLYYQADGAYFQPMIQNGVTVYLTVRP
jgi:Family of unknown function (DUF6515)